MRRWTRDQVLARMRELSAQPGDPDGPGAEGVRHNVVIGRECSPEEEAMRAYVSRVWARDWDSSEDSVYDG